MCRHHIRAFVKFLGSFAVKDPVQTLKWLEQILALITPQDYFVWNEVVEVVIQAYNGIKSFNDKCNQKILERAMDLIDAIMLLKDRCERNPALYNVGTKGATSVTAIADIVCGELGLSDVQYDYTGGQAGWKGDVPKFRYCTDKIQSMGWSAKYSSDEAVRKAVKNNIKR